MAKHDDGTPGSHESGMKIIKEALTDKELAKVRGSFMEESQTMQRQHDKEVLRKCPEEIKGLMRMRTLCEQERIKAKKARRNEEEMRWESRQSETNSMIKDVALYQYGMTIDQLYNINEAYFRERIREEPAVSKR